MDSNYHVSFRNYSFMRQGIVHKQLKKECEDRALSVHDSDGKPAAAVLCDGAGAYENAELGAYVVSEKICILITNEFDKLYEMDEQHFSDYLLSAVHKTLMETAKETECSILSLSTTLLCTAIHPDGRYFYFHIGDGVIAAVFDDDIRIISRYYHEISVNMTEFVTMRSLSYNYGKGKGDIHGFLLMSDGMERILSENDEISLNGKLFLQIAFFMPYDMLDTEISTFIDKVPDFIVSDDLSCAVVVDKRYAPFIFRSMDKSLRSSLFLISEKINKGQIRNYSDLIGMLVSKDRVTIHEATHLLRAHTYKRTVNKIKGFIDSEIFYMSNGSIEMYHQKGGNYV